MEKKPNFFKKIGYSFVPKKYGQLCFQSAGAIIGFVCLLSLFLVVGNVVNFYMICKTYLREEMEVETVEQLVDKYVPEFTIQNGQLDLEQSFDLTINKAVIHIDDTSERITMSDVEYLINNSGFEEFLLGSKSNLIIYSSRQGEYREYQFSDLGYETIKKKDLLEFVSGFKTMGIAILAVAWYLLIVIGYFIKAFFYFLLFGLLNFFLRRRANAGNLYETAVFAILPATLVDFVLTLLPFTIPSEILNPIYFVATLIIGAFGLFSVHEMSLTKNDEKFKYTFDDNPYRVSGFVPDDAGALADENFGGYAAVAAGPKPSYSAANGANTKVRLKGVEVAYSDMQLINRYIKGNMKDLAIQQLSDVSGLSMDDCRDIVENWERYFY
ncbi:MAG: DUF1189 family protein [Lachnospiraceae bacterium]|nr:DUF1189 family protein [Lachnospiraceae bacterium]